ncbi:MAG: ATP-binding protein [Planctomycetaceae bacterium]|jgi:predicted ATP-dependent endonuclease of OLD family|nr:ATP-binding protein [Planctomycetaceae bacterium]
MKVIIKNLGILECAKYELGDLTVVCGKNNTGKTIAAYTLYGFFDYWRNWYDFQIGPMLMQELKNKPEIRIIQKQIQRLFVKNLTLAYKQYVTEWLPKVLGISPERLTDCNFRLDICWVHSRSLFMKNKTFRWTLPEYGSYIIKTDNKGKNIQIFQEKEHIPQEFLLDSVQNLAKYTSPDIIPCVSMIPADRINAELFSEEIGNFCNKMYQQNNSLFQPANNPFSAENLLLNLSESSSSVRSLLSFWLQLYSGTMLQKTPVTMFMIDKPEMNLHPENQRVLARIFARLVNQGYKVYITTHSDYIVKELNTLIMLYRHNRNTNRVMKQYGYSEEELLNPAQVRVYMTQQVPVPKTRTRTRTRTKKAARQIVTDLSFPKYIFVRAKIDELGIYLPTFDDIINEMNTIQDEILVGD